MTKEERMKIADSNYEKIRKLMQEEAYKLVIRIKEYEKKIKEGK